MILADKIAENRKKNGWSQEELAEKLGVSRQSVSKWESMQAVPDMKKVLQLAEIFGVTTDYLLKDNIDEPVADTVSMGTDISDEVRLVSMEEANRFLEYNEKAAGGVSTGVMMCILSPVILIILGGLADAGKISLDETAAGIGGTIILLMIIAAAVAMFLMAGMHGKEYDFLEDVNIDTEYGVSGMAKELRSAYAVTHSKLMIIGIMLCVVSAIPMLMLILIGYTNNTDVLPVISVAVLLIMIACGVKLIVLTSIRQDGYNKLLEEGDYTRLNKKAGKYDGIYWGVVLAVYLGWSFYNMGWRYTWVVWPIAGVLFAVYREVMKAIARTR